MGRIIWFGPVSGQMTLPCAIFARGLQDNPKTKIRCRAEMFNSAKRVVQTQTKRLKSERAKTAIP
jgi:hypothetical protein